MITTHPLLRQLPRALILAVSEEFDNTTFVGCESICQSKRDQQPSFLYPHHVPIVLPPRTISQSLQSHLPTSPLQPYVPGNLLNNLPHESSALAQMTLGSRDAGLNFAEVGFLQIHMRFLSAIAPIS